MPESLEFCSAQLMGSRSRARVSLLWKYRTHGSLERISRLEQRPDKRAGIVSTAVQSEYQLLLLVVVLGIVADDGGYSWCCCSLSRTHKTADSVAAHHFSVAGIDPPHNLSYEQHRSLSWWLSLLQTAYLALIQKIKVGEKDAEIIARSLYNRFMVCGPISFALNTVNGA